MVVVKKCEQITLDIEKGKFQKPSVKDRLELKMHLAMCSKCRRYARDSKKLDLWLKRRMELANANKDVHFTEEEKNELKEKISNH